jgi:hypothetical protein
VLGSSLKNVIMNSLDIHSPNAVTCLLHEPERKGLFLKNAKNSSGTFRRFEDNLSGLAGDEAKSVLIERVPSYLGKYDNYNLDPLMSLYYCSF